MKIYKIIITKSFLDSHKEVLSYIRDRLKNPMAAEIHKKLFEEAIDKLETIAGSLPIVDDPEIRHLRIRKIRVKRFLILFFLNDEKSTAYILKIVHESSNWQRDSRIWGLED